MVGAVDTTPHKSGADLESSPTVSATFDRNPLKEVTEFVPMAQQNDTQLNAAVGNGMQNVNANANDSNMMNQGSSWDANDSMMNQGSSWVCQPANQMYQQPQYTEQWPPQQYDCGSQYQKGGGKSWGKSKNNGWGGGGCGGWQKKSKWDDPNWDICWDFVEGGCPRGENCSWSHRYPGEQQQQPSYSPQVQHSYGKGDYGKGQDHGKGKGYKSAGKGTASYGKGGAVGGIDILRAATNTNSWTKPLNPPLPAEPAPYRSAPKPYFGKSNAKTRTQPPPPPSKPFLSREEGLRQAEADMEDMDEFLIQFKQGFESEKKETKQAQDSSDDSSSDESSEAESESTPRGHHVAAVPPPPPTLDCQPPPPPPPPPVDAPRPLPSPLMTLQSNATLSKEDSPKGDPLNAVQEEAEEKVIAEEIHAEEVRPNTTPSPRKEGFRMPPGLSPEQKALHREIFDEDPSEDTIRSSEASEDAVPDAASPVEVAEVQAEENNSYEAIIEDVSDEQIRDEMFRGRHHTDEANSIASSLHEISLQEPRQEEDAASMPSLEPVEQEPCAVEIEEDIVEEAIEIEEVDCIVTDLVDAAVAEALANVQKKITDQKNETGQEHVPRKPRRRPPPPVPSRKVTPAPSVSEVSSKPMTPSVPKKQAETTPQERQLVTLREACEICDGLGRLNPKTAGFIHVDSRRVANGRFGPGWYFAQPIPFTVPCEMQARGERGEIILDRGATVGIVFVFEDGRHSTAILADGEQFSGRFRLPLFDDAVNKALVQPF